MGPRSTCLIHSYVTRGMWRWADHEIGKKHKKAIRKGDPDEKARRDLEPCCKAVNCSK